ncbi:asparagine synthetase domain-containing protein CG17486 [Drosophila pseudoobscura]|uniref:Asparagine synthetase domain-containing protein CG17486 n=1 Tax=Drosophila pseudoobscura pseudoobscura TaxID=46245 RepID=A0A6I8V2N7_DROPS|nr:asparagine synthetase domain-containing protein CG17486 [Drosophila pseudoobscura]
MCGIFCAINQNTAGCLDLTDTLKTVLNNRGPDVQDELRLDNILLSGSVLWQQGESIQKQPVIEGDCVLLFNGDLYNLEKPDSMADTFWLAKKLSDCHCDEEILSVLKVLEGPYCLIIYNRREEMLYFCRDALGRNSLIIEHNQQELHLLSTSFYSDIDQLSTLELPPLGLYKLKIDNLSSCVLYPWQPLNAYTHQQLITLDLAMGWKTIIKRTISPDWLLKSKLDFGYDFYKVPYVENHETLYENLLSTPQVQSALATFNKLLQSSVASRVQTAPFCRNCLKIGQNTSICTHAKVCILFSGGIDCTVLAILADRYVPDGEPIELINVAFERITAPNTADTQEYWNVPDRKTALQSYNELKRICPKRFWILIEVNVTRQELQLQLSQHIRHLIYPLQTVLDESLGCAFWFATHTVLSSARVALIGSGADELFGGYTRHRNAYRHCLGDEIERQLVVQNELEKDWQRIPARNLARDDRVIADNGKTARAPFIEENVVRFVRSLMPKQKCCYSFPEGVGDKLLLRLYGYQLGLRDAVLLKKRAIQFGSRIADKKQHAAQNSIFLKFNLANSLENTC